MSDKEDPPNLHPPESELDRLELIFETSASPRAARQPHFLQRHLLTNLLRGYRRAVSTAGRAGPSGTPGLAGSTRRYALLVALMVGLTAVPTWIVLRAGANGVDPWLADPVRPFVVPGDSITPKVRPLVPGGRPTRPAPQADPAQAQPAPVPPAVIALPPAPPAAVPARERTRWDSAVAKQRPVWKRPKKVTSRPTPTRNVPAAPHQPPSQGSSQGNAPDRPAPLPRKRWAGKHWTGKRWAGKHWTGKRWAGKHWTGKRWAGKHWTGKRWTGKHWTSKHWTGDWVRGQQGGWHGVRVDRPQIKRPCR